MKIEATITVDVGDAMDNMSDAEITDVAESAIFQVISLYHLNKEVRWMVNKSEGAEQLIAYHRTWAGVMEKAEFTCKKQSGHSGINADIDDYLCAGHAQTWYTMRNLLPKGKCWLCSEVRG
jgi:hypothetical protein